MDRFKFTGILLTTLGLTIGGVFCYIEFARSPTLGNSLVLGISDVKNTLVKNTNENTNPNFSLDQIKANMSIKCLESISKNNGKLEYQSIKKISLNQYQDIFVVNCGNEQNAKRNILVNQNNQFQLLNFEFYNYEKNQINLIQEIEFEPNLKTNQPTKFQVFNQHKSGFDCGQLANYSWSVKDWRYELTKVKRKECKGATVGAINEIYWNPVYP